VISGNGKSGVMFNGPASTGNLVSSNLIGAGADGATKLGNAEFGVAFDGRAATNQVKDNNIRNNTKGADNNAATGGKNKINDPNLIANNGYGILDGTMAGAPVITSASRSGNSFTINGTLLSTPSSQFSLEFFGESSAQRQGAYYLGTATVTTDATGHATFSVTLTPSVPFSGDFITATATATAANGVTSEFSYDFSLSGAHVPAQISLGSAVTVNPNVTFTQGGSFTDPGAASWTATVDYGDGAGPQALSLSGTHFTLSHAYAQPGVYAVIVTVTDNLGATGYADLFVTVAGPAVSLDPVPALNDGTPFRSEGSFADSGGSSWTATVNYGDGSGAHALALNADNPGFPR
jgi:hypothetical protein